MEVPPTLENVKRRTSKSRNNRSEVLSISGFTVVFLMCGILVFAGYAGTKNNISQQELEDGTLSYCCYISESSTLSEIRASSCGCKLAVQYALSKAKKLAPDVDESCKENPLNESISVFDLKRKSKPCIDSAIHLISDSP